VLSRTQTVPDGAATPITTGAWDRVMWTAIPARNPVSTGFEIRSAMRPSFNAPAAATSNPTIRASMEAS